MQRFPLATVLPLLLLGSCSESKASTVAGDYVLDADATGRAIASMMMGENVTPAMLDDVCMRFEDVTAQLKDDQTYSLRGKIYDRPITCKGSWSRKDDTITLEQTHAGGKASRSTHTAVIEDGVLTIPMQVEGKVVELLFKAKPE